MWVKQEDGESSRFDIRLSVYDLPFSKAVRVGHCIIGNFFREHFHSIP
jgi:hypothetical protein